jgi:hypothetical protein
MDMYLLAAVTNNWCMAMIMAVAYLEVRYSPRPWDFDNPDSRKASIRIMLYLAVLEVLSLFKFTVGLMATVYAAFWLTAILGIRLLGHLPAVLVDHLLGNEF